ncbi:MAG: Wzz/FepE/Etk N-terminal domain-containing protein [Nitrospirota bacterium]
METKESSYEEINLIDYINVLKKHRKLILVIIAITVVTTGIVSFLMPKIYEAKAVITPAVQPRESGGVGAIAAQFGITTPPSSNISEVVNLLKSNILKEKVIKRYNLLPVLLKKNPSGKTENEKAWMGIRALKDILKVNFNQKENIIELSVQFNNPKIATDILSYFLTELTDHMSSEAKRVAVTNKEYLESLIDKHSDPFIKQKIYALIAQQIETSMMAEVKENFAFKVLDPPKIPDEKVKPKIRLNLILSFVVSLFGGIFIAFFKEYLEKIKGKGKEITSL